MGFETARVDLKKPVAGYFRISRARDEMSAPDIYRGQIEDYCRYKGLRLAKVFEDVDFSGRRGSKPRPGLEALKQGRRDYSSVIVPKLSRFGRSLKDLTELFEAFDGDGVGLVFLDVDVDTGTSTGRLVRNIMASLAEWESDLISDRWKDAHRHLARRGATNGGRSTPYGYRYDLDKKMPVVVPAQARVVKQMNERFLAGESIHVITDDLTARKVPSRDGGHWWRQTVGDMLENPFYAAMRRLDGEVIEASWEPIIDRQAWDKAYALRQAVKQPPGVHPREGSGKYLLSGLLWCQVCGKRAHRQGTVKRPEKHIYLCSSGWKLCTGGSINARRADRLIAEAFLERMSAPFTEHVLSAPESALKPTASTQEPDNNLEERLRAVDRRMERLVSLSLVADGPGVQKAFQHQAEALESERAHLEGERATRRAMGAVESRRVEDLTTLRAMLSDLEAIWDKATISERRDMLKVAVDRVEIMPGPRPKQLHIDWAEWLTATPGTSPDEPQGEVLIA